MNKKLISITVAAAMAVTGIALATSYADERNVSVVLNGEKMEFDVNPIIKDGTTLVPMRGIFEALGMEVSWNGGNNTVTAVKNGKTVVMEIGNKNVEINGEIKEATAAPTIENGRTLVPVRIISEAMGVDVSWEDETSTVILIDEDKPSDDSWKENLGSIDLSAMKFEGTGIAIEGKTVKITSGGDYTVTGECADGMIYVKTEDTVKLRLSGVNLTNTTGPAIFFDNCKKGHITISKDTENYISDGETYDVDAKGTIFSNDDLEIKGSGTLNVTSNYGHGICSDDKVKIEEGIINITSKKDGIHANDAVTVKAGNITITAEGDGVQSDGYLKIENAAVNITTTGEVKEDNPFEKFGGFGGGRDRGQRPQGQENNRPPQMQGEEMPIMGDNQPPQMPDGNSRPTENAAEASSSSKGIKAETNLIVTGGTININSTDHCIHSSDIVFINGGEMSLSSEKKKGISAHKNLIIDDGEINIQKSTEGIESKGIFSINGGKIMLNSLDDGLNAGGTNGRDVANSTDEHNMYINGGEIFVNANGDGIDSNGVMYLCGGSITVEGPTNDGNGALDSGGKIIQKGGTLLAVGSSGMAEYPNKNDSSQPSFIYNLSQKQAAGTTIKIKNSNGEELVSYTPSKQFQSIVYSSDKLKIGEEYTVTVGETTETIKQDSMSVSLGSSRAFGGGNRRW